MTSTTDAERLDKAFFGHPKALATVFGVEMWERFSFYGMQGILAIYMYYTTTQGGLGINEGTALGIVGAYGGAVYLSSILGAWLADRVLGTERTLFYSAIMIMAGHIALGAVPGVPGLILGLVLVAFGSGGLKSNATAAVGALYKDGDVRRDAGFSIFYMGINLGALIGPLLTGLLQKEAGFHWGFAVAAVGMGIGLIQYAAGRKHLAPETFEVPNPLTRPEMKKFAVIGLVAVVVVVALVLSGVITAENLTTVVAIVTVVATVTYFIVILRDKELSSVERSRVFGFMPLFVASVMFWTIFQQQFTVLAYYSDKRLDRHIGSWEMPVSWTQSINPIFIILFAGVFAALWVKLGDRQPTTPTKLAFGTSLVGVGFLLFIPSAGGAPGTSPLFMLVLILLIFTCAELTLSPVGLSITTKLAPAKYSSQMVALWFLSVALGSTLSGTFAGVYTNALESANPKGGEITYFGVLGGLAIVLGIILFLVRKPILKLMSGVR